MVKIKEIFLVLISDEVYKMRSYKKNDKTENILKNLKKHREKDYTFTSGHILGSMCTQPHQLAKRAYMDFLETNLGDPELFPGTKNIENRLLTFYMNLLNAPKNSIGLISSGGTESNINAMWVAKKTTGKNEIIIPESAHFSFEKIASLMNMKLVKIPLTKKYIIDISKIKNKINKKTAAIIGIAGSTELGTIDPIPEISDICFDEHLFLHVDAAFGGYIIPFLKQINYDLPDFDFRLKGVTSISIDAHKMGCSAIPLGALIINKKEMLETISVETPYISIEKQSGLLGTRSGGPVAAAYAVSEYLGIKGYQKNAEKCMKNTVYLEGKLKEIGLKLVTKPVLNVVGIRLKKPDTVSNKLAEQGWRVNKMERISAIRIVLMPHISKKTLDDFTPILENVCKKTGEI